MHSTHTSMPRIFWMWTTSSYKLHLFKSTEFEILTLLNFQFPNKVEIHCSSLPPQCTAASSLSQWMATSLSQWMASILPLLHWHPPSLILASSLSCWHPPPLVLASSLFQWMASFHLWQQPCPSLGWWAPLPWRTASPPPLTSSFPPPSTNSSFPWWMASPLPQQTVSPFPQQTASSLPRWTVSSLNKCSPPVFQVDWLWVNITVIVRVIG